MAAGQTKATACSNANTVNRAAKAASARAAPERVASATSPVLATQALSARSAAPARLVKVAAAAAAPAVRRERDVCGAGVAVAAARAGAAARPATRRSRAAAASASSRSDVTARCSRPCRSPVHDGGAGGLGGDGRQGGEWRQPRRCAHSLRRVRRREGRQPAARRARRRRRRRAPRRASPSSGGKLPDLSTTTITPRQCRNGRRRRGHGHDGADRRATAGWRARRSTSRCDDPNTAAVRDVNEVIHRARRVSRGRMAAWKRSISAALSLVTGAAQEGAFCARRASARRLRRRCALVPRRLERRRWSVIQWTAISFYRSRRYLPTQWWAKFGMREGSEIPLAVAGDAQTRSGRRSRPTTCPRRSARKAAAW